ncbi:MAG: GAF domain-containing protein [Ignavibacteriales bacterium]|nr:GAF domain-containing protein [Ignavibacteriales bacterium]
MKMDKIKSNALFHKVDPQLVKNTSGTLKRINYPDGKIIFKDEQKGDCLFLVLGGAVKISKKMKTGGEIILGVLHEGDFFGELDLIDRRQRSAQATAIGKCSLAWMGRKQFNELIKASPAFLMNLLTMVTLRLRSNNLTYVLHQETNLFALRTQLDKTEQLVEASKIVNSSIDVDHLLELIFQTAAKTVGADRGTLYLIDDTKKELWSKVQKGSSKVEIRLPIGSGIAGAVAATGEVINIPDAYSDSRFNPKVDQRTGYRTKSTLCMPMKNRDGKIIGVFQLLNKIKGCFTKEDEAFIEAFSVHASLALENAQLAQRMIQEERLSAVGRMASTIIHDIKNPMGVLRVSAQVIKKRSHDEEIKKVAEEMMQQIDRFTAMTQEILDYARGISTLNLQEFDFSDIGKTIFLIIDRDLDRRKIKLEKKIKYRGKIMLDPDKILRAFYNIASNAADAMPNGGKLTVNVFQEKEFLVIEFIDRGCGMPPDVRAKIFEPFFTFGKKHGTGLGMSIVKKIIDDHNGKINIESKQNKGTTIRLYLPLKR